MLITRREAIGTMLAAAAVATSPGLAKVRHVFEIDDGGELWFYSAVDAEAALAEHMRTNYVEAGVDLDEAQVSCCDQWPDSATLVVRNDVDDKLIVKSAREWAAAVGFIATTCV